MTWDRVSEPGFAGIGNESICQLSSPCKASERLGEVCRKGQDALEEGGQSQGGGPPLPAPFLYLLLA